MAKALPASEVEAVLQVYRGRPMTARGRASAFPTAVDDSTPFPLLFGAVRNIELYLEPFMQAPVRHIELVDLADARLHPLLPRILPVLADRLRHPAPLPPAAPTSAPGGPAMVSAENERLLDRLVDPGLATSELRAEMQAWLKACEFRFEVYANGPLDEPPPLPVASSAFDGMRSELDAWMGDLLRPLARDSLVQLYAHFRAG